MIAPILNAIPPFLVKYSAVAAVARDPAQGQADESAVYRPQHGGIIDEREFMGAIFRDQGRHTQATALVRWRRLQPWRPRHW